MGVSGFSALMPCPHVTPYILNLVSIGTIFNSKGVPTLSGAFPQKRYQIGIPGIDRENHSIETFLGLAGLLPATPTCVGGLHFGDARVAVWPCNDHRVGAMMTTSYFAQESEKWVCLFQHRVACKEG
jgi:hypothetical protein